MNNYYLLRVILSFLASSCRSMSILFLLQLFYGMNSRVRLMDILHSFVLAGSFLTLFYPDRFGCSHTSVSLFMPLERIDYFLSSLPLKCDYQLTALFSAQPHQKPLFKVCHVGKKLKFPPILRYRLNTRCIIQSSHLCAHPWLLLQPPPISSSPLVQLMESHQRLVTMTLLIDLHPYVA